MATTTKRVRKTAVEPTTTQVEEKETESITQEVEEKETEAVTQEVEAVEVPVQPNAEKKVTYKAKREMDPQSYVTVRNGFNGVLVYKSRRTGEKFVWQEFGDEQDMELMELKAARNASKDYFINNWFLFDDPAVIEWLGMERYYKHALNAKSFDEMFFKTTEEIKQTVSELSKGQKRSVVFRAKQLIDDGTIDSIKTINALESCLGVELIER